MFQGKSVILRENVPYVRLYRHDQKHLCAKSQDYGGTDARKAWPSCSSAYRTSLACCVILVGPALSRQRSQAMRRRVLCINPYPANVENMVSS